MIAPIQPRTGMPVLKELRCPNCGAALQQHLPNAQTLICSSCHTHVAVGGEEAQTLSDGVTLPKPPFPIFVGDTPTFDGVKYFVMGRVVYRGWDASDPTDRWHWTEWLLGSEDGQMLWLAYDEEAGFALFKRMKIKAPFEVATDHLIPIGVGEHKFPVKERYPAKILGAEGELTWQAKRGDDLIMVEGEMGNTRYSIQSTAAELEMYEGTTVAPEVVGQAFARPEIGQIVKAASTTRFGILAVVGALGFVIACISLCFGAFMSMSDGEKIASQTITLNNEIRSATFPVELQANGRPVKIKVKALNNMPVNTYMGVDISVTQPDGEDLFVFSNEFWHETGTDDEGRWEEQDYDGTGRFMAAKDGTYIVEVGLDEANHNNMQIQVDIFKNTFYPTWSFGYAACVGVLAVVLLYFGGYIHFESDDDDDD